MNFENALISEQGINQVRISNEPIRPVFLQREGQLLAGATFQDGKVMKDFFGYLTKLHTRISFEFYRSGIWGVERREEEKLGMQQSLEAVSTIQFPHNKLKDYTINLEILPNYNQREDDKAFFSLNFETAALIPFFKGMKADSSFGLSYFYGNNVMYLINNDTGSPFPINITFSLTAISFPLSGPITDSNFISLNNTWTEEFAGNAANLTKVKDQLLYNMFIDVQKLPGTHKVSIFVHSSERKFNLDHPKGSYDKNRPPDFSFGIKSEIMKGLGLISKINEKGFLEFYFVDNYVLRIVTQIGNFGKYNLYILSKRY